MPVAVFGADGRRPLTTSRTGLKSSIGLLFNNESKTVCSAFCVGARTIATASHCLFRQDGRNRPRLASFRFALKAAPEQPDARLAGHRNGTVPQHIVAGGQALRIAPPIDASHDWALARLAEPICRSHSLPLAEHAPDEIAARAADNELTHVSFHRDFKNWALAETNDCHGRTGLGSASRAAIEQDFAAPQNLFLHRCDTGGASSGSPLLVDVDGRPHVVAINVGTYVQTRLMMRGGQVVHRFKADAIANTAVTSATFADALRVFRDAAILATSGEVRELQRRLAALGLYRGTIDGAYGPQTRRAIIEFELARGATPTGLASQDLLSAVRHGLDSETIPTAPSLSAIEIRSNRPTADHHGLRARDHGLRARE